MINLKYLSLFCFCLVIACKNDPSVDSKKEVKEPKPLTTLPLKKIDLVDLSEFNTEGTNWQIGGAVYADLNTEGALEVKEGTGVLINKPSDTEKANITTIWEHGDIDLELDFLVPKGSNSGIYLQGRYELQILDSWGKSTIDYSDCGGIYQRWDESKPEGQKGYEGTPPRVNASKAPGLWQHFRIEFQAPRFDKNGVKTQNAIFKKVFQNGFLIHENVELTGPTRGPAFAEESATGPLFIQGDHGPIAFKHIKYKAYTQDQLSLTDITYEFFDGKDDKLPDFSTLTPSKTGELAFLNVRKASDQGDGYRLRFKGKLEVPVAGEYLFTTRIDDGGELFIDGKSIVFNEGDPGYGVARGLTNLTVGTHDFVITYYQEVWGANLVVEYEGPGIIQQALAYDKPVRKDRKKRPPILKNKLTTPEMVRAFVNHEGEKKTNILSIGDPKGVHYSYDLRTPNLIKTWKGEFADVTKMWQGRGEPQLLQPMNFAIDLTGGLPVAALKSESSNWPSFIPDDFKFNGYEVGTDNRPIFKYHYKNSQFTDQILPSVNGNNLVRTISKTGDDSTIYFRLAAAEKIEKLPNGLFSINGAYYIKGDDLILRDNKDLIAKVNDRLSYEIHW